MECPIIQNKEKCKCSYEPCPRKGRCCECLSYHWSHKQLPACLFPEEIEKTYDRSLSKFIEIYTQEVI
jgi:hypothetical protein